MSVDLDPQLIERARVLTGERSNRAVLDLALRRLIASKQKGAMIAGIAALSDLERSWAHLSFPLHRRRLRRDRLPGRQLGLGSPGVRRCRNRSRGCAH